MDFELDIHGKIDRGDFENKMDFPSLEKYTKYNAYKNGEVRMNCDRDEADLSKNDNWLIETVFDKDSYNFAHKAYRENENLMYKKFKEALFEEYGVSENPKRDMAFDMAWDREHAYGYHDVVSYFSELVELIE